MRRRQAYSRNQTKLFESQALLLGIPPLDIDDSGEFDQHSLALAADAGLPSDDTGIVQSGASVLYSLAAVHYAAVDFLANGSYCLVVVYPSRNIVFEIVNEDMMAARLSHHGTADLDSLRPRTLKAQWLHSRDPQ